MNEGASWARFVTLWDTLWDSGFSEEIPYVGLLPIGSEGRLGEDFTEMFVLVLHCSPMPGHHGLNSWYSGIKLVVTG